MENKKQVVAGHGSSSLDHLFGPKDVSSSTSSTTGLFGTIFPLPSAELGKEKKRDLPNQVGSGKNEKSGKNDLLLGTFSPENVAQSRKGESSGVTSKDSIYQNYQPAEPCYFSSSIYYGGQENYSPRTSTTHESQHIFKKDGSEDDSNGNNSNSALRGNWWQGSLYY